MQQYKLHEAIVGIDSVVPKGRARLICIPAGSVVRFPNLALETAIVEIEFEGRKVGVFLRDLKDRGELEEHVAV